MAKWESNNFTKLSKEEKIELEKKENQKLLEEQKNAKINDELKSRIPFICTNCKNTNSKKLEICEWCGNKMI